MGGALDAAVGFLADQPLALLFLLLAGGSALGAVRVLGVQAGPAAVLFAAMAVAAVAAERGEELAIPAEVGTLGLVLFAYTVGAIAGPGFLAAVRSGWAPIASVAVAILAAAGVALGLGRALELPAPVVAGTFAGAVTNTPALAAATERAGDAAGPTVGYSIAYVIGVLAMLAATARVLRRRDAAADAPSPIENRTIRVERGDGPRIAEPVALHGGRVAFSRLRRAGTGAVAVPEAGDVLQADDLVTVVGPAEVVRALARDLGHTSSHALPADRGEVDFRRITLSRRRLAGRTVADLDLGGRFGAVVTRASGAATSTCSRRTTSCCSPATGCA